MIWNITFRVLLFIPLCSRNFVKQQNLGKLFIGPISRSYKGFNETKFKKELKSALRYNEETTYNSFKSVFLQILTRHILEIKGSVQYRRKRAHLVYTCPKYPYVCLKKNDTFSLILRWTASDNRALILSKIEAD